jgi:hypothetical protein
MLKNKNLKLKLGKLNTMNEISVVGKVGCMPHDGLLC